MSNNKRTAQEVPVQEQYIGRCKYCQKLNKVDSYTNRVPKFCMQCGKPITYQRIH